MTEKLRIGIVGYGNVGKGVEKAIAQSPDLHLSAIFTRRNPTTIQPLSDETTVVQTESIDRWQSEIDVLALTVGSKSDLFELGPQLATTFNIVDSYDIHPKIETYFKAVDRAARLSGKTATIAAGWDPGLLSLQRLYAESILPIGHTETFWGSGVSQGHSEAIRQIPGVIDAVQYTIPRSELIDAFRAGESGPLTNFEKHRRLCYVAIEKEASPNSIRTQIETMPDYFEGYETVVTFITAEELRREHRSMPHGGSVLRFGTTDRETTHSFEFTLRLRSNPDFTGSILAAAARATVRLNRQRSIGAYTLFDIAPALLSPTPIATLRQTLL